MGRRRQGRRPRAFPLGRLNIMCRERDAPNVCYYNVRPAGKNAPPLPDGLEFRRVSSADLSSELRPLLRSSYVATLDDALRIE